MKRQHGCCRTLVLMLCLLLCALPGLTQQLPLRHYGQLDGLENLAVTALAQDAAGYLWVGTENGLYRFEGGRLRRYAADRTLPSQSVSALYADQEGSIWVGTSRGLCYWQDKICHQVHTEDGGELPVLPGQKVSAFGVGRLLVVSKGQIWLLQKNVQGHWRAQAYFTTDLQQRFAELKQVFSVLVGQEHDLWLGCGYSLCHYRGGQLDLYAGAQGLPVGEHIWSAMLLDEYGELWLRSRDGLMMSLPAGATRLLERRPRQLLLGGIKDPVLGRDADGRLITSNEFGLLRGWPGHWQALGSKQGFKADDTVTSLLVDRDQDVWIGLGGRGLLHWQGYRQWDNWTQQHGLPSDTVWSFVRTRNDRLYVGTERGLARFDELGARFVAAHSRRASDRMQWGSWAEDHSGQLWGGTFSGVLLRLDRQTEQSKAVANLPMIIKLLVDRTGQLWICTERGLYVLARPDLGGMPQLVVGSGEGYYYSACQTTQGALWFADVLGLSRYFEGRWSRPKLSTATTMRWQELSCDEGSLWMLDSAKESLWRFDADALATRLPGRQMLLEQTPISGRAVQTLLIDRRHWLWVGSDSGVAVWNGQTWQVLNQQSGLIANDTSQHALYEDRDGSIWIGTSSGASHLKNPEELFTAAPLQLSVNEVRFDAQPLALVGTNTLPWRRGVLTASISTASSRNHEALRYRYRLLGLEDEWNSSELPLIRYTGLAPGQYTLQLMVENQLTQISSRMVEVGLTLAPPWWRQPWFYGLISGLLVLALLGISRWRLALLMRRQREMERLILERTQELEASREEHRLRAATDSLTGIWNRACIIDLITAQIVEAQRSGSVFLLVLLDIDYFKRINDRFGHLAGDAVLREFVRRVRELLRSGDAFGRYGGEEFLLLLPGLDSASGPTRLAQIHAHLSATPMMPEAGVRVAITASMGVACERDGDSPEAMIRAADQALYRAKKNGRNRIEYAE